MTSLALGGRIADCPAAILPLRIATSFWPSIPAAGSITRPPRRRRSKLVFTDAAGDMCDLLFAELEFIGDYKGGRMRSTLRILDAGCIKRLQGRPWQV